jgi:hypothetical protein
MNNSTNIDDLLADVARGFDTSKAGEAFSARHGVRALSRLTITSNEVASLITDRLRQRVEGRTVIEIGGGTGLLSFQLAKVATRVFCIEANPLWSSAFVELLLEHKPSNLSYLFGTASEFYGSISGDVAVLATHSDVAGMKMVAAQFAPTVIDIYGEMIADNPGAFDPFARQARGFT